MNIVFYSNMTKRESCLQRIPELKEHNVSFFRLDEREKLLCADETEILIAGITHLTVDKIYQSISENISRLANGRPLKNRVN